MTRGCENGSRQPEVEVSACGETVPRSRPIKKTSSKWSSYQHVHVLWEETPLKGNQATADINPRYAKSLVKLSINVVVERPMK